MEEEGPQELSFTDSEFSALTWWSAISVECSGQSLWFEFLPEADCFL